jgi:hypothetical protein
MFGKESVGIIGEIEGDSGENTQVCGYESVFVCLENLAFREI